MKSLYSFISGLSLVLSFGFITGDRYPYFFSVRSLGRDWENVGLDIAWAIKQLEGKDETSKQESP